MGGIRPPGEGEEEEKEAQLLLCNPVPSPDGIGHRSVTPYTRRIELLVDLPRVEYKPARPDCKLVSSSNVDNLAGILFTSSEGPNVDDIALPAIRDESPASQEIALT